MHRIIHSRWFGIILSATGLIMMLYGIYRGELAVIFTKATNICLECIGIG